MPASALAGHLARAILLFAEGTAAIA